MTHLTLVVVGGGVFVARLCDALAASDVLPRMHIRLTARRWDRLRLIAEQCRLHVKKRRPTWSVTAEPSLPAALAVADAIVLLMRVGGAAARSADERFPRRFGLTGDEGLGPGGIANALRSLPVLEETARVICKHAPRALMLNMVAPLGLTTRLLIDEGLDAFGVCELPVVTQTAFERATGYPFAECKYAGFNHLGWFWPRAIERNDGFFRTIVAAGLADEKTVADFGAAPLRYYYEIFDAPAAEGLGFRRSPCRAEEVQTIAQRSLADFAAAPGEPSAALSERSTPWFDQALVPLLEAFFAGRHHEGFLDLRNGDLVRELPPDVVVEVRASVTGGLRTTPCSLLPPRVKTFLQAIATSEQFAYHAARTADASAQRRLIESALSALPYREPLSHLDALADAVLHCGRYQPDQLSWRLTEN